MNCSFRFYKSIDESFLGSKQLGQFFSYCQKNPDKNIKISWATSFFLAGNFSASLAGVLYWLSNHNGNSFTFDDNCFTDNHSILHRNGFRCMVDPHVGFVNDPQRSIIPLRVFNPTDVDGYCQYIENDFLGIRNAAAIPSHISLTLQGHYHELFANYEAHAFLGREAEVMPIFTCGQLFPKKRILKFTMMDLGNSIPYNVDQFQRTKGEPIYDDWQSLSWAVRGNTTKIDTPGGSGLKGIKDFCEINQGDFVLMSRKGLLESNTAEKVIYAHHVSNPIPGTTMTLICRY